MEYRGFGTTGIKTSALGFGAMRLPHEKRGDDIQVNEAASLEIMLRAFQLGVNYVDTAYTYLQEKGEAVVGKALRQWGKKVYLATKAPTWRIEKRGDYRRFLEEQLVRLQVSTIDFHHFHGLDQQRFEEKVQRLKLIAEARKARDEKLINHISFSFHDKPEVMKRIIGEGVFSSVLCQYNLLDQANDAAIRYAAGKGVAVVIMGPVGGGRLASSDILVNGMGGSVRTTPELALRFVLANPHVSVALSGMNTVKMVEENVAAASVKKPLNREELAALKNFIRTRKARAEIPCTSCGYCLPCPQNVAIPEIFQLLNYATVYGLTGLARTRYRCIGSTGTARQEKAEACVECGQCEEKCPQKIAVIKQLKKARRILG